VPSDVVNKARMFETSFAMCTLNKRLAFPDLPDCAGQRARPRRTSQNSKSQTRSCVEMLLSNEVVRGQKIRSKVSKAGLVTSIDLHVRSPRTQPNLL
jgi:hypothetical protein